MTLNAPTILTLTALAFASGVTGAFTVMAVFLLWVRHENKKP